MTGVRFLHGFLLASLEALVHGYTMRLEAEDLTSLPSQLVAPHLWEAHFADSAERYGTGKHYLHVVAHAEARGSNPPDRPERELHTRVVACSDKAARFAHDQDDALHSATVLARAWQHCL